MNTKRKNKQMTFAAVMLLLCIVMCSILTFRFSKVALRNDYPSESEKVAMINIANLVANEGVFSDDSSQIFDTKKYRIKEIDFKSNSVIIEKITDKLWGYNYYSIVCFEIRGGEFKNIQITDESTFKIIGMTVFGGIIGIFVWNAIMSILLPPKKNRPKKKS